MTEGSKDIINRLQQQILQWQGFAQPAAGKIKGIGLGPLEAAFPNGVFPTGAIHEMVCPTPEQAAATGGLMAGVIASLMKQGGACLWISTNRKLFPPALTAFTVAPDRVIFIDGLAEKDILWVMEQALKCEGLAAVIAEVKEISIVQSRRLQLAVESSRVTGFLLRNDIRKLGANTCVARWQISPLPSEPGDDLPGVGFPRWQVDLLRVRNGNPGSWQLEWVDSGFVPVTDRSELNINETRIAG
jgi:protein ImuA